MIDKILNNIDILISKYFSIKSYITVCILVDEYKMELGLMFKFAISNISKKVNIFLLESATMHGDVTIPELVFDEMKKSDLIISLVSFSLAHTQERYESNMLGKKFVSMPDYTIELLGRDCFDVDFELILDRQNKLYELLKEGNIVNITTANKTDITFEIDRRVPNNCPGFVNNSFLLASPPDFEVNIAVAEDKTQGWLVVDGSIPFPGFGLLNSPIELEIKNGKIVYCSDSKLLELFNNYGESARVAAELGFGFNYKALLSGIMLEDEGCYNTFHVGFGSNITIGGKNNISFHLDAIIKKPIVKIDEIMYIQE